MPAYHARVAVEMMSPIGAQVINTLHFEVDTLTSPPNWQSIASDIDDWLRVPYLTLLSDDYSLVQFVVSDEEYPGSTLGQGASVVNLPGERPATDEKTSSGLCIVGSCKTAVAKRYARGRIFFPPAGASAALWDHNQWDQTNLYWQKCLSLAQLLPQGHAAGSTSYVYEIFSKSQVLLGKTPFSFPVKSIVLSPTQHFLRSRTTAP